MFKQFQSVLDHLSAQMQTEESSKSKADSVHQISIGQAPTGTAKTRSGLNHVQSVRAQIESTSPITAPLFPSRTGPVARGHQARRPQHKRGSPQQLILPASLPLGCDDLGKTFVPSGRSFEPLRINRQARPSGPRSPELKSPNLDQPDIQYLRRALKPVTTGNKVKSVVDKWEGHKVMLPLQLTWRWLTEVCRCARRPTLHP
jgi:hypothetical protein